MPELSLRAILLVVVVIAVLVFALAWMFTVPEPVDVQPAGPPPTVQPRTHTAPPNGR
jgi:hypothetical protein